MSTLMASAEFPYFLYPLTMLHSPGLSMTLYSGLTLQGNAVTAELNHLCLTLGSPHPGPKVLMEAFRGVDLAQGHL